MLRGQNVEPQARECIVNWEVAASFSSRHESILVARASRTHELLPTHFHQEPELPSPCAQSLSSCGPRVLAQKQASDGQWQLRPASAIPKSTPCEGFSFSANDSISCFRVSSGTLCSTSQFVYRNPYINNSQWPSQVENTAASVAESGPSYLAVVLLAELFSFSRWFCVRIT